MKILKTINVENLSEKVIETYKKRETARAVIFDSENKIAMLYLGLHGFYMVPGGGIEKGETILKALHRECREEAGCEIKDVQEMGVVASHRSQYKRTEYSHFHVAHLKGEKMKPKYTKEEIEEKTELHWMDIGDAIEHIYEFRTDNPTHHSIQQRELFFLEWARDTISMQNK